MLAIGRALLGETAEGEILLLLVLVGEALNNLCGMVNFAGDVPGGSKDAGLGLSGTSLLCAVVHLVLGDNGEGSLEFLIVDELL